MNDLSSAPPQPYDRTRGARRPTGRERPWGAEEIIVSKTDLKGHITYANDVFIRVAEMEENELLGKPHNVIRHPGMPRCIFKLMWERIQSKQEIFAYVNNLAKSGDNYWVFAHVTPNFAPTGNVTGYTSFRRKPLSEQVRLIAALYEDLVGEETRHSSPKDGLAASYALLEQTLKTKGLSYDEFLFSF